MSCSVPNVAQVVWDALRNQMRVKVMKVKGQRHGHGPLPKGVLGLPKG